MSPADSGRSSHARVLFVGHTAQLGGNELGVSRLLPLLDNDEFEVVVLLFQDGPFVELLRGRGLEVHVRPLANSLLTTDRFAASRLGTMLRYGPRAAAYSAGLTRWMRQQRIDLLWANTFKAMALATPGARVLGIPVLWHLHDRISPEYLPPRTVHLLRWAFRRLPDAVVANADRTAATTGRTPRPVVVHPGLVPGQERRREHQPPGRPVIGMLGRISSTKGQLELMRSLPGVLERHPEVQVRIVGSAMFGADDYETQVQAEAVRLGIADAVTWVGFASDPRPELDRMTVCVHAATVPEPFGQVITEAMARCVPVIATRGGGATDIVAPAGRPARGELVEPGDVKGLADALLRVLSDPEAAQRRATAVQPEILATYSIDHSVRQMHAVWRRLLGAETQPTA